jgi:DNA-binding NarL/FixJ family response regulator
MIRLLIADASEALRIGLRMIFSLDPQRISIVAEESNAQCVLQSAQLHRANVVIIDGDFEDADTIIPRLSKSCKLSALIVLTMKTDPQIKQYMHDLGASLCIEKRASPQELLNCMRDIAEPAIPLPLAA